MNDAARKIKFLIFLRYYSLQYVVPFNRVVYTYFATIK